MINGRFAVPVAVVLLVVCPRLECAKTDAPPAPLAEVAGQPITSAEVDQAVAAKLFRLRTEEYQIRRRAIDEIITKRLLATEAARRAITIDELLRLEVDQKIEVPTDEQIRMVYDGARDRFGGLPEEAALAQIATNLRSQRASAQRAQFVAGLRSHADVRVLLEPPRLNVLPGSGPTRGPANAPVTIVEYSDFECPFCNRATATVAQVLARYPAQVRLVFHHFPLPMHREAALAAKAAVCAGAQGKFWEMHDALFAHQSKLAASDLVSYATVLGVDGSKFRDCLADDKITQIIATDRATGESYGITGTPAFFINGRLLTGAAPLTAFLSVVDEELGRTERR